MSSNVLTADQQVESIKKFKFHAVGDKDEIEILIPEVSSIQFCAETNMVVKSNGFRMKCVRPVANQANQQIVYDFYFQLLQPGYSFYSWPSSSVLAWWVILNFCQFKSIVF